MLSYLKTRSPGTFAYWSLGFLFLAGMHYFQSHPGGDGLQVSYNAFAWIPVSFFLGFSLFQIVSRSAVTYSVLTLGLLASCVLLLLPALYPGSNDITSIGRFYGLAAGLLFFLGLQQLELDTRQRSQLLFLVLVAVIIEALLGFAQHFELIPEGMLGYESNSPQPWGIFRQPNVQASFMATGLVISAFVLPSLLQSSKTGGKLQAAICLLMPLFTVPIILLLNSRVGWLGAGIGAGCLLPFLYQQSGRRVTSSWVVMLLLGVVVGFFLLASSDGGFSQAAAKAQLDPIRMKMYPAVLRMILDFPVLGVGYGNFEPAFNAYAADLYASGLAEPSGVTNLHHPHNELLFWAAEGGMAALIGLLLAAYLVFRTIMHCQSIYRLALIGLFFPIVLHTQTEYPFYHSAVHFILFVMLIYIADSLGNSIKKRKLKSTLLVGTSGIVIPLVTTGFMATTLHASAVLDRFEKVPGTSPEVLLGILNPVVWRDRLLFTVRGNLMYAGLTQGDTSQVQQFIDLTLASIDARPRWQRYQDLIFCYDILGWGNQAAMTLAEAQYRFPTVSFSRLGDGQLRLLTVSPEIPASAIVPQE